MDKKPELSKEEYKAYSKAYKAAHNKKSRAKASAQRKDLEKSVDTLAFENQQLEDALKQERVLSLATFLYAKSIHDAAEECKQQPKKVVVVSSDNQTASAKSDSSHKPPEKSPSTTKAKGTKKI